MLKIEQIDNLLREFFSSEQVAEIKKMLSSTESKKLEAYLKDAGKPLINDKERHNEQIKLDFIVTYAKDKLSSSRFIEFLLNSAESLKDKGEYRVSLDLYDHLLHIAEKDSKLANIRTNCFLAKADLFQREAKWDESLLFLKRARKEFEKVRDLKGSAKCENLLGTIYGEKGNIKKAKFHFEKSLSLLHPGRDKILVGMLEINLGIIYSIQGNFDQAFSYLQRALVKFEQIQDYKRVAEIRHNIGMLFTQKGEFDSALTEFDNSISISNKPGYLSILSLSYLSKAYIYTQLKDFYLAAAFADKAMELSYSLNDRLSMADIYKIKGIIEKNLKNYKLSENYLLTSLRINQELSNKLNQAESSYELGALYSEMGYKEKAKEFFSEAANYFKSINSQSMISKLQDQILQVS